MKRKTSTVPSRVYTYGCRTPTEGAVLLHQQLSLAHRYYNDLIAIERERREEYRVARAKLSDKLTGLEAECRTLSTAIDALRDGLKAKRRATRTRTPASKDERDSLRELMLKRRAVLSLMRAERLALRGNEDLARVSTAVNASAKAKVKEKRAASGLYWGTYLLVEKAVEQASKSAADPGFRRLSGTGSVGVQLQNGMAVKELFGSDPRIQIDPLPPDTWRTRSGQRHAHAEVRFRIGSDGGRKPIWAKFPVLIHRPLPADAQVKWAILKVSRIGPRYRYELQLTVESRDFVRQEPKIGEGRVVALDIGWRRMKDDSFRVGYLYDVFGGARDIRLPAAIPVELSRAASVRSINDKVFGVARNTLTLWSKTHPELVSDWLREELTTMHAWHARGRLARVARRMTNEMPSFVWKAWVRWRQERLGAGLDLLAEFSEIDAWLGGSPLEAITVYLDFWRKKEAHLWDMECAKRTRALRRRKDLYRVIAHELSSSYYVLVLEDINLAKMTARGKPEADGDHITEQVRAQNSVAPNELRDALKQAFGKDRVVLVSPENTTRLHHACGHLNASTLFKEDQRAAVVVTCDHCKVEFDQDRNAAQNLLALYLDGKMPERQGGRPGDDSLSGSAEGAP